MTERTADAEMLAALLDGRLADGERAALLADLALSEDDLEILAEAAAVTRELEAEDGARSAAPEPLPPPAPLVTPIGSARRRAPRGLWVLAAAAVAGLALAYPMLRQARPGGASALAFAAGVRDPGTGQPPGAAPYAWPGTRGTDGGLSADARAVRVGARQVDLRLALRAGDGASARAAATDVAALLRPIPGAGTAAGIYARAADVTAPARVGAAELAAADSNAERLAGRGVALGAWAEAARVAAARHDAGFFRETRGALDRLSAETGLAPGVTAALRGVRASLPETDPPSWTDLIPRLDELLAAAGG